MSRFQTGGDRFGRRDSRDRAPQKERQPVDVLAKQMKLAQFARQSLQWDEYERARDVAINLVMGHRIEDAVTRFRQVITACTGWQDRGDDARELIEKKLKDAFVQGIERGQTAHDLLVRMQRIPLAAATLTLVSDLRRGDGELCIGFLFSEDGHLAEDISTAYGDDPARIAAKFTERDWSDFVTPLLAISPGELRPELMDAARKSLRRTLAAMAPR